MGKSNNQRRSGTRHNGGTKPQFAKSQSMPTNSSAAKLDQIEWHAPSPQMLADAGRFTFNNRNGEFIDFATQYYTDTVDLTQASTTSPGIMAFRTVTCPGLSKDNTSAVNRAGGNIFSVIRKANSGARNYDAPDLLAILLAMDSIYYMHTHIKRAYGAVLSYSAYNLYYPRAVVESMGFDYTDFRKNIVNYRMLLNDLARQINCIHIPNCFPWYQRHMNMFKYIFTDSTDPKAQEYLFVPHGYYTYEETLIEDEPAVLQYHEFMKYNEDGSEGLYTYEEIYDIMHMLVDKVYNAEDLWIISGDVKKAYDNVLMSIDETGDDYSVEVSYDEEALIQIHNMNMMGAANINGKYGDSSVNKLNVTQNVDTNALIWNPQMYTECPGLLCDKIINMHDLAPSPALVMIATRLTPMVAYETALEGGKYGFNFHCVGSEFVNEARVFYFARSSVNGEGYITSKKICSRGVKNNKAWDRIHEAALLSKFKEAPQFTVFALGEDGMKVTYSDVFFEFDNYTVFTKQDLALLHNVSIMGMFGLKD